MKRRHLLRLAFALPLAGCGSGWNLGFGPIRGGGGDGGAGRAPVVSTGRVVLPAGSPLSPRNLRLASGLNSARLSDDGTFTLEQLTEAPSLLALTDTSNRLLLLGFSGSNATELVGEVSPLQTSVALLFFALGGFTLPMDQHEKVRALLKADSRVQELATTLETELATNPYALAENDTTLIAEVTALRDTLLPSLSRVIHLTAKTRRRDEPLSATLIQTSPENEAYGFLVGANGEGLGLMVTNSRRRNAILSIYESAYTPEGATDPIKVTDPSYHRLVKQRILWGTSGLAGVVGSLVDYANGTVVYSPTPSGPYDLDVYPSTAVKTEYRVEIVANGNTGDSSGLFDEHITLPGELTPTGQHIKICFITFVKDFLVPAIATFAGLQNSLKLDLRSFTQSDVASTELLKAFDDLAVLFSGVIDFSVAISANNVRNVLVAVLKAIGNNGTLRQKFIEWFVRIFAKEEFAGALAGLGGALASIVNVVVVLVDKILGVADLGAVISDWLRSDSYLLFTSKVIEAKLKLSPEAATVTVGESVNLKANTVVDAELLSFHWRVLSGAGKLINPVSGSSGTDLNSASREMRFESQFSLTKETVVIEVEGFVGGVNDPNRKSIGTSKSTITVNPMTVTITPSGSTISPGDSLLFSAAFSGNTSGSLRYLWTLSGNTSGVSLAESEQSTVQLTTTATAQGVVTIGVSVVGRAASGEVTTLATGSTTVNINDKIPFGSVRIVFDGKTRILPKNSVQKLSGITGLALGATYQRVSSEGLEALKLIFQFATPTVAVGSTSTVSDSYDLTLELPGKSGSEYFAPSERGTLTVTEVGAGYFGYSLSINLKGLRGVATSGHATLKGWVTGY